MTTTKNRHSKILALTAALSVLCAATACKGGDSKGTQTTNATASPHYSDNSGGSTPAGDTETEYVSLADIYDVSFTGISPFLTVSFKPKVIHLPIWEGQKGDDRQQRQVKLLIEGEEYEEKAKSDGSIYWDMASDTKLSGKLKNGDEITLLPDKHATNYDIPGDGSLELGTYYDPESGKNTKYILKDNTVTVSGADEYVWRSEVLTQSVTELFSANVNDVNYKFSFNQIGLIENYAGIVSSKDNMNVTIDKTEIEKVYLGTTPDNAQKNCVKIVCFATLSQGKKEPVSGYVVSRFDSPVIKDNAAAVQYTILNSEAYKTLDEAISAEITNDTRGYVWTEVP
jgi:hypothetical protein